MSTTYTRPRKVALLGAFDRFNYGDLLFPIIAKNEMTRHNALAVSDVFALVESNLSHYGALKTHPMRALYKPNALNSEDIVMFAGGGTIGVDWVYMHSNLLGTTGNKALYYLKRIFGDACANWISKYYFGARAPFPWVAGPEDFPVPVSVAYNAVGGSEFAKLSARIQAQTLDRLKKSTYLSVRDRETKRLFGPLEDSIPVHLAPDSAVLMSEQFPIEWLETQTSTPLREIVSEGAYICFQSNINFARANADRIATTLDALHATYGLRILLLPIGRYVGLDDLLALQNIKSNLLAPATIVSDEASIWEIMYVIANARLFLGTSLHGNVTSQSFAVPHLGLSDKTCKLDFYLETWDLPDQARCVKLEEVTEFAGTVMAIPQDVREKKRSELIDRAHENFSKMATACGLEWQ